MSFTLPAFSGTLVNSPAIKSLSIGGDEENNLVVKKKEPLVTVISTTAKSDLTKISEKKFDDYLEEFRRVARGDYFEYGEYSRCDELIETWSMQDQLPLSDIISYIFTKSIKDKRVSLFLLKGISALPYEKVGASGPVQAMAYLPLADDELAEAGLRAFESWESPEGIPLLEQVNMRSEWLNRYRLKTIEYLKGL